MKNSVTQNNIYKRQYKTPLAMMFTRYIYLAEYSIIKMYIKFLKILKFKDIKKYINLVVLLHV